MLTFHAAFVRGLSSAGDSRSVVSPALRVRIEARQESRDAEQEYRRRVNGDFVLARLTVIHANGEDYANPAG